mgnify:FL=1
MRSKQAMKNLLSNLILQVIVFVVGIILPRFFLEEYGSTVNGMVTSINQFLTYMGLAEAGVGTASVVALYAPLADKQQDDINSILSATRLFYYRSGMIFIALVTGLVVIYPYLISKQLPANMVRMMIVVLASSTLVDYLFLGKYKVILTAMQRGYVVAIAQSVGTVMNMVISILLIEIHANVVLVKAVATGAYILRFFVVRWYVKKQIPEINFKVEPNYKALSQRGAALLHQVVGIIVNNTDVVILTVMLGSRSLVEVSVYSIYNMIISAVYTLLNVFANGLTAGFGEVISKKENDVLNKSFSSFEYMYFIVFYIVCICVCGLLLPFVKIYTMNVKDAEYVRPLAAFLFILIVFLQNIRVPGMTMICAAGHFKETQPQAIREAAINLVVSLLLVKKFGMVGVLFGTVCSYGYRSIEIILYNRKYLVLGSGKKTWQRIIRNTLVALIIGVIGYKVIPVDMLSYTQWFLYAIIFGIISSCFTIGINYIFEPEEFRELIVRVLRIIKKDNNV